MSKPQIRSSQLITTFGPGAMVDLPNDAVIIAGTDSWRYGKHSPPPTITEPRLQRKLEKLLKFQGIGLRKPPPANEERGFTPDIAAFRFPEWFIVQHPITTRRGHRARRLVKIDDLERKGFRDNDGKRYSVVPVRFVRACERGLVGDIDWHAFVHDGQQGCHRELYIEERGTSGGLDAVWVRCACGGERPMSWAMLKGAATLGRCDGNRPWLGPGTREACTLPNRLLIRSASNAYFPQLLSVISIPDSMEAVDVAVGALWAGCFAGIETDEKLEVVLSLPFVQQQLEDFSSEQVKAAIARIRTGPSGEDRPVKDVEYDALAEADEESGHDVPDGDFLARALPKTHWDAPWMEAVERVVLVHRLREVVAQVGFTRFEAVGPDIQGELDLDLDVEPACIGIDTSWRPAIENRGEGIFLQFSAKAMEAWLERSQVKTRDVALQQGFQFWLAEHEQSKRAYPGLPYYMLHSLSHLLLTAISLDCGYPASSLRERVYATPGRYAILVYTGSSDAEGTLGGLVEEGRRVKYHMQKALEMGALCSNDPVCALHVPERHNQQPLLGSACHGCLLISEISCEQHNDFLDRALVVPTVEACGAEFFKT